SESACERIRSIAIQVQWPLGRRRRNGHAARCRGIRRSRGLTDEQKRIADFGYLFPDVASVFDKIAEAERPREGGGEGRGSGARVFAEARSDGSDAVWSGPIPVEPRLWVLTPPAFAPPLEPL